MQLAADTNVVVSGLLWQGPPRQILDAARHGELTLFTSPVLLAELAKVLRRPKFSVRLQVAGVTHQELVSNFAALAQPVIPNRIDPVIAADPDDDAVLACAVAVPVDAVVSGDQHLLALAMYQGIPILTPMEVLQELHKK